MSILVNNNTKLIVQIESLEAINNLEKILKVILKMK